MPVDGLKEMCFGSFEGRNYVEMEHDPDYQAWVAANCESSCPDGERKDEFSDRICKTFAALVDKALADGEDMLVILAHGGTQMAALYKAHMCLHPNIIDELAEKWTPKTESEAE